MAVQRKDSDAEELIAVTIRRIGYNDGNWVYWADQIELNQGYPGYATPLYPDEVVRLREKDKIMFDMLYPGLLEVSVDEPTRVANNITTAPYRHTIQRDQSVDPVETGEVTELDAHGPLFNDYQYRLYIDHFNIKTQRPEDPFAFGPTARGTQDRASLRE